MLRCCSCGLQADEHSSGLIITPAYFDKSRKSGRLIVKLDRYPDGLTRRFLCSDCLPAIADLIGLFEPGFDFPQEIAPPLEADYIIQER